MAVPLSETLSKKISAIGLLGTILVVSIHVSYKPELGSFGWWFHNVMGGPGLASIAVPYFFAVSGFMLARHADVMGWWKKECRKRLRTLLVPYLVWNALYWSIFYLPKIITGKSAFSLGGDRGLYRVLGLYPLLCPIISHLWFVRCLMLCAICSFFIVWLCRCKSVGWGYVLVMVITYFTIPVLYKNYDDWSNWFVVMSTLKGFTYFSLGMYLCYHPIVVNRPKLVGGIAFLIGITLFCIRCQGTCLAIDGFPYYQLECGAIAFSLAGVWLLWPGWTFPKWMTSAAFPIYCMHIFSQAAFVGTARRMFGIADTNATTSLLSVYLVEIAFVWAASMGITLFLRRYLPWFAKIAFGGR